MERQTILANLGFHDVRTSGNVFEALGRSLSRQMNIQYTPRQLRRLAAAINWHDMKHNGDVFDNFHALFDEFNDAEEGERWMMEAALPFTPHASTADFSSEWFYAFAAVLPAPVFHVHFGLNDDGSGTFHLRICASDVPLDEQCYDDVAAVASLRESIPEALWVASTDRGYFALQLRQPHSEDFLLRFRQEHKDKKLDKLGNLSATAVMLSGCSHPDHPLDFEREYMLAIPGQFQRVPYRHQLGQRLDFDDFNTYKVDVDAVVVQSGPNTRLDLLTEVFWPVGGFLAINGNTTRRVTQMDDKFKEHWVEIGSKPFVYVRRMHAAKVRTLYATEIGRPLEEGREGTLHSSQPFMLSTEAFVNALRVLEAAVSDEGDTLEVLVYRFGTKSTVESCAWISDLLEAGFRVIVDIAATWVQTKRNSEGKIRTPSVLLFKPVAKPFRTIGFQRTYKFFTTQQGTNVRDENAYGATFWERVKLSLGPAFNGIRKAKLYSGPVIHLFKANCSFDATLLVSDKQALKRRKKQLRKLGAAMKRGQDHVDGFRSELTIHSHDKYGIAYVTGGGTIEDLSSRAVAAMAHFKEQVDTQSFTIFELLVSLDSLLKFVWTPHAEGGLQLFQEDLRKGTVGRRPSLLDNRRYMIGTVLNAFGFWSNKQVPEFRNKSRNVTFEKRMRDYYTAKLRSMEP
jgi:hypothetical protein